MADEQNEQAASVQACPLCHEHRVAILHLPDISVRGYEAYSDLLMMGDRHEASRATIGCLACGAEWPDPEAFRAASERPI